MSESYHAETREERDQLQELLDYRRDGVDAASRELDKISDGRKGIEQAWRAVEREVTDDYLYVVRHEHGFVKLGWSGDPDRRFGELQKACPYDLTLETTIRSSDGRKAEQIIHEVAEEYHHRGEWYLLPDKFVELLSEWAFIDGEGRVASDER